MNLYNYSSRILELPIPKLLVFYNGTTDEVNEVILRLSDSFKPDQRDESDIEIKVRMLNVNYGHNMKPM